jgi:hypothetical protein
MAPQLTKLVAIDVILRQGFETRLQVVQRCAAQASRSPQVDRLHCVLQVFVTQCLGPVSAAAAAAAALRYSCKNDLLKLRLQILPAYGGAQCMPSCCGGHRHSS